jgi:rhomboid protease GluP
VSDPLGGLSPEGGHLGPDERQTPEQVEKPRTPPRPTTWALLIVLFAVFAAELLVGHDWKGTSDMALFRMGALFPPAVRDGDWWRIGSYAFLHIGWMHIAANAYALWILGPQLEWTFGSNLMLGLFAATALAGGAASTAWSFHTGQSHLAAGASGGIFGLFGATIGLYTRVRHNLPAPVRQRIIGAIGINLLINVAIATMAPVDTAAHVGGLVSGVLLALVAPLPRLDPRPWHALVRVFLICSALALAAMEGAAFARAIRPKPRTLRGNGAEAQVSGLLVPIEPGIAFLPGVAKIGIARESAPLTITPGEDAVRIGDRTWLRQSFSEGGTDYTRLAAADAGGRLVIEFACGDSFCQGAAADRLIDPTARTIR